VIRYESNAFAGQNPRQTVSEPVYSESNVRLCIGVLGGRER
jgi:hypothetical protein